MIKQYLQSPSPEWLQKPEEAVRAYVRGMVPHSADEALRSANIPTDWRDPEQLAEFAVPGLKPSVDLARQAQGRYTQVQAAEQTPAYRSAVCLARPMRAGEHDKARFYARD
jgi:hypothetical protein